QRIGDGDRQQCLFVHARVCVDQQDVQIELADKVVEPVVEQTDVVAFAQDARDLACSDTRGHQEYLAGDRFAEIAGHLVRGRGNRTLAPQVVVERGADLVRLQAEQDV